MRYIRSTSDAVYEQARKALDAAWGLGLPATCIEPAATAPRDDQGQIVLAVDGEFCAYSVAAELLPQLLASGAVTEITDADYRAAVESPSPVI